MVKIYINQEVNPLINHLITRLPKRVCSWNDKEHFHLRGNSPTVVALNGSKGLEYKIVMVMDVCEGIIPYNKAVLDEQIEEERRLFYVAMTRAKEKLYLLYPKQRYNKDTTRSRFIEELLTARYPLLRTDLHTP